MATPNVPYNTCCGNALRCARAASLPLRRRAGTIFSLAKTKETSLGPSRGPATWPWSLTSPSRRGSGPPVSPPKEGRAPPPDNNKVLCLPACLQPRHTAFRYNTMMGDPRIEILVGDKPCVVHRLKCGYHGGTSERSIGCDFGSEHWQNKINFHHVRFMKRSVKVQFRSLVCAKQLEKFEG